MTSQIIKAIVIFDTTYGNTEKIAKSLEIGLKEAGILTVCMNARDVAAADSLNQYDLICLGALTHFMTASRPMKSSLESSRALIYLESMALHLTQSLIHVCLVVLQNSLRRN
jgi:menaquinone-dependent protoporphyrinogen IX oxidase